jgi:hypothetical protein
MGLSGNLSMGEILEQIIHADRILANEWNDRIKHQMESKTITDASLLPKLDLIRNVVFMGMGEVRTMFCVSSWCHNFISALPSIGTSPNEVQLYLLLIYIASHSTITTT